MRRSRIAILLALGLVLSACSGDEERALPTPSAASTSVSPSPSPTPTPSPRPTRKPAPAVKPPPPKTSAPAPGFSLSRVRIRLTRFASGLSGPLYITHAGDGSGLLYIVGKGGVITVHNGSGTRVSTFLNISGLVSDGGEQGLLGLAFHPSFERNRRFFVNYTDNAGDTIIAEYRATSTRSADAGSRRVLLKIDQPFANHNGGMITFGPDGYLYIGMGDGGSAGDPFNNAQNLGSLLGKILRIDVNSGSPYGSPSTNPFRSRAGARDEVWHYGLRNPWRFSFDRSTRAMFIGDVGQGNWEEIDVARSSGRNFGWKQMEGNHCFVPNCNRSGKVLPIAEYSHSYGCSVTGGYVYRGPAYSSLRGAYFYGDNCSGRIWALDAAAALRGTSRVRQVMDTSLSISSFGENQAGEMFVCDLNGAVYRLRAA